MKALIVIISLTLFSKLCVCDDSSAAQKDISALIEGLAISQEPASEQPLFITMGNEEENAIARRVYRLAAEIRSFGKKAFPLLLENFDDKRQSVPFRSVLPSDVGDACYCIITRQLYSLPKGYAGSLTRVGSDQKVHQRPLFITSPFDEVGLKKWLKARDSKTLIEMKIEVLKWVLEEERKIGISSKSDHGKFIAPLELHLKELIEKSNGE